MTQLFKKILIANRGEIACRVIRSCKKLGIKSVAVYSEADESAPHVHMADEAVLLGPPPSNQSYLLINKIIEVSKKLGVDAIHPGYGFLSENAEFATKLEEAGITFIGPKQHAVRVMGDKIESKNLATSIGVPCIKGHNHDIPSATEAAKIAEEIGYPVMVKAAAGGGGKGMRIVREASELKISFDSAKSEAISSFGDGRIFMEKFVENPRHIEIQVMFDKHGKGVYLNERECSIQRRNQKIIEEAPSVFVDQALRDRMGADALKLGAAVDYVGAGTVEFMMDANHNYYFLEMNTRLQVEHPVTELTTGVDLVEQQIRVAAGEPLALKQEELKPKGWAVEVRIYSEDPRNSFLPSTGTLFHYVEPKGEGVRVDAGVKGGYVISLFYDPMIAKLITFGNNREEALTRMNQALHKYEIGGVTTNIDFLMHILKHQEFVKGNINTNFISKYYPAGFEELQPSPREHLLAKALIGWNDLINRFYKLNEDGTKLAFVRDGEEVTPVECNRKGETYELSLQGQSFTIHFSGMRNARWKTLTINGIQDTVQIFQKGVDTTLSFNGVLYQMEVYNDREAKFLKHMPEKIDLATADEIHSPMPGKVVKLMVEPGMLVKKGEPVAVLEAMKMENPIRMHKEAKVVEILCKEGDSVEGGQLLFKLSDPEA